MIHGLIFIGGILLIAIGPSVIMLLGRVPWQRVACFVGLHDFENGSSGWGMRYYERCINAALSVDRRERVIAPQWQPIDTAPRDGTRVLCFDHPQGRLYSRHDLRVVLHWDAVRSGWRDDFTMIDKDYAPTHWMEIPNPPVDRVIAPGEQEQENG